MSDDEIAFQIIENVPSSNKTLIEQLHRLADADFTVIGIRP